MVQATRDAPAQLETSIDDGVEPITLRLPPEWCLTDQALMAISSLNGATQFERSEEGALIISFAAGGWSSEIGTELSFQIMLWSRREGGGHVRDASAGYKVGAGAVREPDVSWFPHERLDQVDETAREEEFAPFCPPFVVEIVSPRDSVPAQQRKMEEWMGYGVRLGWLIDRQRSLAWIYRAGQDEPELLERPSELSGEDVLPGLVVECSRIWKPEESGGSE